MLYQCDALDYVCQALRLLLQEHGVDMPARPDHIGAEWVLESAGSPFVEHALSKIERDDDEESDAAIERAIAAGGSAFSVEFSR